MDPRLRQDDRGVSEWCKSRSTLRVPRESGLVDFRTDAQRRIYRARAAPLLKIDDWLKAQPGPIRIALAGRMTPSTAKPTVWPAQTTGGYAENGSPWDR
jgi:hypothetical protein